MKRFTLEVTIVDSKSTVVLVKKDSKVVRNTTLRNSDIQVLIDMLVKT